MTRPSPTTSAPAGMLPDGATYRVQLANQLLIALESGSLTAEPLLMMARRLANAVESTAVEEWLTCELAGYPLHIPASLDHRLRGTNRRVYDNPITTPIGVDVMNRAVGVSGNDPEGFHTRRESLHQIETVILAARYLSLKKVSAKAKRDRDLEVRRGFGQPWRSAYDPTEVEAVLRRGAGEIHEFETVSQGVRSELHRWVASELHRLAFVDVMEATFSRYKAELHRALMEAAPEVAEKVPSVYDRLRASPEDQEAVSQAMATCRRMIVALADALYPASSHPVTDEAGVEHRVTRQDVLNRLQEFMKGRCSKSRAERLRKALDVLFEKLSGGLKAEGFSLEDAEPLFLHTYLVLGEIASLKPQP